MIEAPLEPLLVVAGAGSGKTATMAARVVYLLANGLVEPGEVLGLTFTRKAAAELSERVRRRLREVRAAGATIDAADRPRVATYNSYAGSIVRDHALRLGFPPDATHVGDAGRFQLADEVVATWAGDIETGLQTEHARRRDHRARWRAQRARGSARAMPVRCSTASRRPSSGSLRHAAPMPRRRPRRCARVPS